MRKAAPERGVESDLAHQLVDVVIDIVGAIDAVHARRFADDFGHSHARIERRERVLEHHLDLECGIAAFIRRHLRNVGAAPHALALGRREYAGRDAAERRFSAAGFASESDDLAFVDGEAHVVQRMHGDFLHIGASQARDFRGEVERTRKILGDVFEFEQRGHGVSADRDLGVPGAADSRCTGK